MPLYTTDPASALLITPLDTLTAIYHRRSGITHLLAEPMLQILGILQEHNLTTAELLDALNQEYEISMTADSPAQLQARLDDLIETGLVWSV